EALERQAAPPGRASLPAPGPSPGLPVGTLAPDFQLANLAGGHQRLSDWRGRRVLLIFFNPRRGFCSRMVPDLAALPIDPGGSRGRAAAGKPDPAIAPPGRNGRRKHTGNRSLSESRLNRGGLPAGTPAPAFRLPRLDGGEISLEEYRGRRVLLVFSDPHCGP